MYIWFGFRVRCQLVFLSTLTTLLNVPLILSRAVTITNFKKSPSSSFPAKNSLIKTLSKNDEVYQVALAIMRGGSLEIGMQSQLNDGNQTKNLKHNQ